ncbi:MAG TPA: hypothetical protein VLG92_03180 [Candidatus Saccharimonadia bacterium]|nr:hypothetical protein [Candidatus Saccharimonadia bacterium]
MLSFVRFTATFLVRRPKLALVVTFVALTYGVMAAGWLSSIANSSSGFQDYVVRLSWSGMPILAFAVAMFAVAIGLPIHLSMDVLRRQLAAQVNAQDTNHDD